MFEFLFGAEVPLPLKIFLAFVIVFGLIGVIAWLVRRVGSDRFGGSAVRGRQPRLAVIDAAAVDARRRLVIIRRDNVEHLLMIGGPTDVVVETNIVRATAMGRESPAVRATLNDALARPVPLDEGALWPLQPQPETSFRPQRSATADEPAQWTVQANLEQPPRPKRHDTLAGLAEELSSRSTPPRDASLPPVRAAAMPDPVRPAAMQMPPASQPASGADQNLAEMAHRLEAALRKPQEARSPETPAKSEPNPPRPAALEPKRADAKPAEPKSAYDSLEQEMANLLGRPPGKT